ncbi:ABC transporter ATP-binding protein, partial [Acinetobacter baumannii]
MAGMTLTEKEDMSKYILHINRSTGITIVMIEHDMRVVMDLSEHITVLSFGRVIARGNPEEIVANPEVQRSYL